MSDRARRRSRVSWDSKGANAGLSASAVIGAQRGRHGRQTQGAVQGGVQFASYQEYDFARDQSGQRHALAQENGMGRDRANARTHKQNPDHTDQHMRVLEVYSADHPMS
jgi:hypothetical protein